MGVLRFRLFGFPVEVQPGFWILALILVVGGKRSALEIAILLGVIIVSLLAHELGHAVMARVYGEQPRITLHMMGGLTSWSPTRPPRRGPSILITLAGPFAGFGLGVVAFVALILVLKDTDASIVNLQVKDPVPYTLLKLVEINAFWSVINLLPVLPFDGGQVMAAALGPSRRKLCASISLVFGLIAAAVFWRFGMILGTVFFALGAIQSFFAAREAGRPAVPPEAVGPLLDRASAALDAGEHDQARKLARAALEGARDAVSARRAVEIGAWAALLSGDVPAARATLRSLPAELPPDALLDAAVLEADGDIAGATNRLLAARRDGDLRAPLAAMLVRLLLAEQKFEQAARLTEEIFDDVGDEELREVAERTLAGGAREEAARLFERLHERSGLPRDADRAAEARQA